MSDYLDPANEELLKDFFDEADLQVSLFEQSILAIENNPSDREAIDEMFRAAHTLKGAAATVQMSELTGFTHTVEDVLDEIRGGAAKVSESAVDLLLQSIDTIKKMLEFRGGGEVFEDDIGQLVEALNRTAGRTTEPKSGAGMSAGKKAKKPVPVSDPEPETVDEARREPVGGQSGMSEYEMLELLESTEPGKSLYRIDVAFDESNPMNTVGGIQVYAALKDVGTVVASEPDVDELFEDEFRETVLYFVATEAESDEIVAKATITDVVLRVDATVLKRSGEAASGIDATAEPVGEDEVGDRDEESHEASEAAKKAVDTHPKSRERSGGSVLRVDSRRIDTLLNLVSEAVINKATCNQIIQSFGKSIERLQQSDSELSEGLKALFLAVEELVETGAGEREPGAVRSFLQERFGSLFSSHQEFAAQYKESYQNLRNTAQSIGRITSELQEGVMQIRMVPISQIFARFPRLVRDLSKSLEKRIQLEISGEETELDKSIIEDLLDPLIHCVRNSIDHGIESPEDRARAGKNETGTVKLKAGNEGNQIVIEIDDDGKGIDVEAVYRKAVDRGIIHPNKQLSEIEAFNLVFEPGFSTAAKITDISGRGVGLDVVKKQIDKLNGTVNIWSVPGAGTRTTIKLPLTLAILQGLLVRVGTETYAVPIISVVESNRIRPDEIRRIDSYEVMDLRDEVISLLRLDRLFRIEAVREPKYHFVVIVGDEEKKVGLIVDSLIGEEDVVIKPLKDRFTNSPGIAGATILGNGRVALIIDVAQLLDLGMTMDSEDRRRRAGALLQLDGSK